MDRNSAEFKKLQAKWYKKLKASGFEDAEDGEGRLKVWSSHYFQSRYSTTAFNAQESYFRMAGQFLHTYAFESRTDREIWRQHAEGRYTIDIFKDMRRRRFHVSRDGVHAAVIRLSSIMLKQMLAGGNDAEE
jgi:hypothetical protein